MNWLAFAVSAMTTILIAIMMVVMPSVTPRTVPLGVNVPQERVGEAVIGSSVRRYRGGVIVSLVISLAVAAILSGVTTVAAAIVPTLLMFVLGFVVYLITRSSIQRAKRSGGWYDGVPVRLSADIRPTSETRAAVQPVWYFISLVVLFVVAAVGVARYGSLPDPLPIHWSLDGTANGFAAKSWLSVFGPLLIGLGMLVLLYLIAVFARLSPTRGRSAGDPGRVRTQQRLMQGLLGQLALAATVLFGATSIVGWLAPGNGGLTIAIIAVPPVLLVAIVIVFVIRYSRAARTTGRETGEQDAVADTPDDDRYWKAGGIYVNRNDPALMVPKRFGIGWTVNFGHPAGWVIFAVLIAVIVIVPILTSHAASNG